MNGKDDAKNCNCDFVSINFRSYNNNSSQETFCASSSHVTSLPLPVNLPWRSFVQHNVLIAWLFMCICYIICVYMCVSATLLSLFNHSFSRAFFQVISDMSTLSQAEQHVWSFSVHFPPYSSKTDAVSVIVPNWSLLKSLIHAKM